MRFSSRAKFYCGFFTQTRPFYCSTLPTVKAEDMKNAKYISEWVVGGPSFVAQTIFRVAYPVATLPISNPQRAAFRDRLTRHRKR